MLSAAGVGNSVPLLNGFEIAVVLKIIAASGG